MPYQKSFENRGTYFKVTVSGDVSFENEMDLECYLNLICEQASAVALLTDMRRTRGSLSLQEGYSLAAEIGEYHRRVREAIVDSPTRNDLNKQFEVNTSHRGFEFRWFHDMDEAVQWLHSGNVLPFPVARPAHVE